MTFAYILKIRFYDYRINFLLKIGHFVLSITIREMPSGRTFRGKLSRIAVFVQENSQNLSGSSRTDRTSIEPANISPSHHFVANMLTTGLNYPCFYEFDLLSDHWIYLQIMLNFLKCIPQMNFYLCYAVLHR